MIIMASAPGTLVPAIARLVAADEGTVRDVIHTFNAKGLAALDPRWAGGRPRLISDGDIEVIVTAARTRPEKPGQPFTHWSLRKLAGYLAGPARPVRIGRERLRQLLHERGISFQRRPACAGVMPAPATPACWPPSAANAPGSAANASNAGAARNLKLHNRAGESRPLCVTTSRAGPEPAQGII